MTVDELVGILQRLSRDLSEAHDLRRAAENRCSDLQVKVLQLTRENVRLRQCAGLDHRSLFSGEQCHPQHDIYASSNSRADDSCPNPFSLAIAKALEAFSEQCRDLVHHATTSFELIQTQHTEFLQQRCQQLEAELKNRSPSTARDERRASSRGQPIDDPQSIILTELRKRDTAYHDLHRHMDELKSERDTYEALLKELLRSVGKQYSLLHIKAPEEEEGGVEAFNSNQDVTDLVRRCQRILPLIRRKFLKV